jgi:hypothetical protein
MSTPACKLHGRGVPQHMGRNGLAGEGGACRLRGRGVPGDEQLDSVAAEGLAAAGGEQRVSRSAAALAQPGPQGPDHLRGERGAAFLAAFAGAPDVRAGAQVHVGAGERGELGDPQPGLDGHREQGVIAAAGPAGAVRGGQQRLGFPGSQVGHDGLVEAGGRDGQDPLDQGGVLGVAQGGVAEQRVDRGQPRVAGARAVMPVVAQVLQEGSDEPGVEVV